MSRKRSRVVIFKDIPEYLVSPDRVEKNMIELPDIQPESDPMDSGFVPEEEVILLSPVEGIIYAFMTDDEAARFKESPEVLQVIDDSDLTVGEKRSAEENHTIRKGLFGLGYLKSIFGGFTLIDFIDFTFRSLVRLGVAVCFLIIILALARAVILMLGSKSSLLIHPFKVISSEQTDARLGESIAELLSKRIRYLESILTETSRAKTESDVRQKSISLEGTNFVLEGTTVPLFTRVPTTANPIDVEFKPYSFDIVGLFNKLYRWVHRGDTISGIVTLGKETVISAEYQKSSGKRDLETWRISATDINDAVNQIGYMVIQDLHALNDPYLTRFQIEEFKTFIEALRYYQAAVRAYDQPNEFETFDDLIEQARLKLTSIVSKNQTVPLVFTYLGSVYSLQQRIEDAAKAFEKVLGLNPEDSFAQKGLDSIGAIRAMIKGNPEKGAVTYEEITSQKALADLQILQVQSMKLPKKPVRIAVLGSGIDIEMQLPKPVEDGVSFVPGVSTYDDKLGHGTAIAALIVSICPEAQIVPIKVVDDHGRGYLSWVINGIGYALRKNVDVLLFTMAIEGSIKPLGIIFERAYNHGTLMIAPAGSMNSQNPTFPGSSNFVFTVGAVDTKGGLSFSNYGNWVNVFAPGEDILSVARKDEGRRFAGSAFSAAIVTATVATMLSSNSELTPELITKLLESTAIKKPAKDGKLQIRQINHYEAIKASVPDTQSEQLKVR